MSLSLLSLYHPFTKTLFTAFSTYLGNPELSPYLKVFHLVTSAQTFFFFSPKQDNINTIHRFEVDIFYLAMCPTTNIYKLIRKMQIAQFKN